MKREPPFICVAIEFFPILRTATPRGSTYEDILPESVGVRSYRSVQRAGRENGTGQATPNAAGACGVACPFAEELKYRRAVNGNPLRGHERLSAASAEPGADGVGRQAS